MKKVLIVDDEPICTAFISMALESEGYAVQTANKAADAIKIAAAFKPDILITDWMLKDEQDGIDVARTVRADLPALKTVFITGMAYNLVEAKASAIPNHAIIVKPIELDDLMKKIS